MMALTRNALARRRWITTALAVLAILGGWTVQAAAGPIVPGTFYEFGFTDPGVSATGCAPDDPGGSFCIPSSGTPTVFLDAPPWTFVAGAGGVTLTVTDAFENADQFEIFDLGAPIGFTSLPAANLVDCGDDPVVCLTTAGMSTGVFALAVGPHSITIVPTLSSDFGGAAYLAIDGSTAVVPLPASVLLLAASLGVVGLLARARRR